MKESIPVELGDTIYVCGQLFVITEVNIKLNAPSVLVTKQPIELVKELAGGGSD